MAIDKPASFVFYSLLCQGCAMPSAVVASVAPVLVCFVVAFFAFRCVCNNTLLNSSLISFLASSDLILCCLVSSSLLQSTSFHQLSLTLFLCFYLSLLLLRVLPYRFALFAAISAGVIKTSNYVELVP